MGHFTAGELTRTLTGLPNQPDEAALVELARLCADALEPARTLVGALRISSGYRSPAVNAAVGGSSTSAHVYGRAADVVPLFTPLEKARGLIADSTIPFDQLIFEQKSAREGYVVWLHIGIAPKGQEPRRQQLIFSPLTGGHYPTFDPRLIAP